MPSAIRVAGTAAILALAALGPADADVTRDNFLARTTTDLLALCDAGPQDPHRLQAIHFCHGFVAGVADYHQSLQQPGRNMAYCLPEQRPTRNQAIRLFVDWAKANPQRGADRPADGLFRFAQATWPCRS